jgi:transposase
MNIPDQPRHREYGSFGLRALRGQQRPAGKENCYPIRYPEPQKSRKLRDRRAVARYAGLTGSPDESGLKSREKGLAKAGNARVRRGLIQLAWRFLLFQKNSALARWYRTRTEGPSGARKTTMIVALARKLLIALWRLVTTGEIPDGVELRPAA